MFAENIDDARGLFRHYFEHFGIPFEVDGDGDLSWDFEIDVDQLDFPLPGFGTAVFTYLEGLDACRLEVSQTVMSPLPTESAADVARLIALVNQDVPKGLAFVVYEGEALLLAATVGIVSDVFSKKMVQFLHRIPQAQLTTLQPAVLATLRGVSPADAKAQYWD